MPEEKQQTNIGFFFCYSRNQRLKSSPCYSVLLLTPTSGYLNVSMRNGILASLYSPYTFKTDNTFVIKHLN